VRVIISSCRALLAGSNHPKLRVGQ